MIKYLFGLFLILGLSACNTNSSGVVACPDAQHFEGSQCVSNMLSCSIEDGQGIQTWTGTAYSACAITKCNDDKHPENGKCIVNSRSCSDFYGEGVEVWNGESYSVCQYSSCIDTYHLVGVECLYDVTDCAVNNGSGFKVWNNDAYGECQISCNSGYHLNSTDKTCDSNTIACTIDNGSGQKVWSTNQYSACQNIVCNAGYTVFNNACISNSITCSIDNGVGTKSWNGSDYGSCNVSTCNNGFHKDSNACLSNVRNCDITNGNGSQTYNPATSSWGSCSIISCLNNYHVESGSCQSDTKLCTSTNGQGVQRWNVITKSYGSCLAESCNNGFHVESNSCNPNTKNCTIQNGQGTATWNEQSGSWGSCLASSCNVSYHIEAGICQDNTKNCPISNGTGVQSWVEYQQQYGACTPISCSTTYHINSTSNLCDANQVDCFILNGSGTSTWNGTQYGSCVATNCITDFHIENGICLSNQSACSIDNGNGLKYWDQINKTYGSCQATNCNTNYHVENFTCQSNQKSCTINNFTGTSFWSDSTQSYSSCTITGCVSGYHLENQTCMNDQKSCPVSHGTGTQLWNGTGYAACANIVCDPSYFNYKDKCIAYSPVLSTGNSNQVIQSKLLKINDNYLFVSSAANNVAPDLTQGKWTVADSTMKIQYYLTGKVPTVNNYEKFIYSLTSGIIYLDQDPTTSVVSLARINNSLNKELITSGFDPNSAFSSLKSNQLLYTKKKEDLTLYTMDVNVGTESIYQTNFPSNTYLTNIYTGPQGSFLEVQTGLDASAYISMYKNVNNQFAFYKSFAPTEVVLKYFEIGSNFFFNIGNMTSYTLQFYKDFNNSLSVYTMPFSHTYNLGYDNTQTLEYNGLVYLNATSSSSNGMQLFKSDSITSTIVKKLPYVSNRFFHDFKVVGGGFYVFSRSGTNTELYFSDGSTDNLTLVKSLGAVEIRQVINVNDKYLVFVAEDSQKDAIWISDKTDSGTVSILTSQNKIGVRVESNENMLLMGIGNSIFKLNINDLVTN